MIHLWKRSASRSIAMLVCLLPCSLTAQSIGDGAPAPATEQHYAIQIHMISIPCEKGEKGNEGFPQALQSLVLSLDPRDIEVAGDAFGAGSDDGTGHLPASVPGQRDPEDPAATVAGSPSGRAILFVRPDDASMDDFMNQLKRDPRCSIANAPQIQVPANFSADVREGQVRPFCAALIPDDSGVRNVFRSVYEGSRYRLRLENPTPDGIEVFCQIDKTKVKNIRNLEMRHPLGDRAAGEIALANYQIQVPELECDCQNLHTTVRFGQNTLAVIGWEGTDAPETGIPIPGKKIFTNSGRKAGRICQILCLRVFPLTGEETAGTGIFSLGDSSEAVPIVPIR